MKKKIRIIISKELYQLATGGENTLDDTVDQLLSLFNKELEKKEKEAIKKCIVIANQVSTEFHKKRGITMLSRSYGAGMVEKRLTKLNPTKKEGV